MKRFAKVFTVLAATAILLGCPNGVSDQEEADTTPPTVVSLSPAHLDETVSPATTKLVVTFSEPMYGGYSICTAGNTFPALIGAPVWTSDTTIEWTVSLNADTIYSLSLNAANYTNFKDAAGNALDPVYWAFITAAE